MNHIRRVVLYTKNLRYFAQCQFSSESASQCFSEPSRKENTQEGNVSRKKYQEREICLFGPKDMRAPLPGNIGVITSSLFENNDQFMISSNSSKKECDIFTKELPFDRYKNVITQFFSSEGSETTDDRQLTIFSPSDVLECVVQECPRLLCRDFADLFPGREIEKEKLTVITLCQKTRHDMSTWSEEIELEREELIGYFIKAAEDICAKLNEVGYWADFIDPSSGRPYLGPYTNATMFETDERYRHFGFIIEDLGCCKVLSHHLWGTRAFVGSLFTNAPLNSPEIQEIIEKHKSRKIYP
ncbi:cobalamin trafficking protein CblD isoform X1 [Centruroides vittatus]|uniref:cobalamin trafficking protein CblD isoform X1 n=1 Tax=Centruroides vittatus TaxID=120091 RepID=UPI00350EF3FE